MCWAFSYLKDCKQIHNLNMHPPIRNKVINKNDSIFNSGVDRFKCMSSCFNEPKIFTVEKFPFIHEFSGFLKNEIKKIQGIKIQYTNVKFKKYIL